MRFASKRIAGTLVTAAAMMAIVVAPNALDEHAAGPTAGSTAVAAPATVGVGWHGGHGGWHGDRGGWHHGWGNWHGGWGWSPWGWRR